MLCSESSQRILGHVSNNVHHFPNLGYIGQNIFQPLELLPGVNHVGCLLIATVVQIGVEDHDSPSPGDFSEEKAPSLKRAMDS